MRVAIYGGGISGCVLARVLADSGDMVTIFEKERIPGGVAVAQPVYTFTLYGIVTRSYVESITTLEKHPDIQYLYKPTNSALNMCQQITHHKNISLVCLLPVQNPIINKDNKIFYDLAVACCPIDSLLAYCFGRLAFEGLYPQQDFSNRNMWTRYANILEQQKIQMVGSAARHITCKFEDIVRECLELRGVLHGN